MRRGRTALALAVGLPLLAVAAVGAFALLWVYDLSVRGTEEPERCRWAGAL